MELSVLALLAHKAAKSRPQNLHLHNIRETLFFQALSYCRFEECRASYVDLDEAALPSKSWLSADSDISSFGALSFSSRGGTF